MTGLFQIRLGVVASLALSAPIDDQASVGPTPYWEQNAKVVIGHISDNTVRVMVAPVDEKGNLSRGPASTVLADPKIAGETRGRLNVTVGVGADREKATVTVITIKNPSGKTVQELRISDADGAVEFLTGGPVLGLGSGDKQFDRSRGLYPIVNGQVSGKKVVGGLQTH